MADSELLHWRIYEITTQNTEIHGVMLRGRIRKLGLEHNFNVLCDNATDKEKCVRFAVLGDDDAKLVEDYLRHIIPDVTVELVAEHINNPVLSKLQVNKAERYAL